MAEAGEVPAPAKISQSKPNGGNDRQVFLQQLKYPQIGVTIAEQVDDGGRSPGFR
jgi:hypothetical protein